MSTRCKVVGIAIVVDIVEAVGIADAVDIAIVVDIVMVVADIANVAGIDGFADMAVVAQHLTPVCATMRYGCPLRREFALSFAWLTP